MQAICKHCGLVGTTTKIPNHDYSLRCDYCRKISIISEHQFIKNDLTSKEYIDEVTNKMLNL